MESRNPSSELHVEVHPGNGPYQLLVHGILSSRAQWILNLEAFAKIARPVVVELWGHGRSPAPESPDPYKPEGYIKAFEQIRNQVPTLLVCGKREKRFKSLRDFAAAICLCSKSWTWTPAMPSTSTPPRNSTGR